LAFRRKEFSEARVRLKNEIDTEGVGATLKKKSPIFLTNKACPTPQTLALGLNRQLVYIEFNFEKDKRQEKNA